MLSFFTNTPGLHSFSINILGLNLSGLSVLKLFFVFFLFNLTIFLYFCSPRPTPGIVESTFFNKTLKNILLYGSAAATFYGTGLAVKSEIYSGKLEAVQKELAAKSELLKQSMEDLAKTQNELKQLADKQYYAKLINANLEIHYNALKARIPKMLEDARKLRDDLDNPEKEVSAKVSSLLDFKQSTIDFNRDITAFKSLTEKLTDYQAFYPSTTTPSSNSATTSASLASPSIEAPTSTPAPEIQKDALKEGVTLKKSSIINWDSFESLTSWEKLAVSLLLTKSIIFSALLGLVFNYYGDFLLTRFKIETRFPKLGSLIKLRRSFSRYYFFLDCSIILGVIILETIFSLFILKISFF